MENATDTPISAGSSVNETIRRFPRTIAVFNEFGIDACCGGAASISDASRAANADPAALLRALERAAVSDGSAT